MRISISEKTKVTKTFKYLFGIELSIYNMPTIEKAFEELYPYYKNDDWEAFDVYLDDHACSDYSLEEELKSDNPQFIYFIKMDKNAKDFQKNLDIIKTSSRYIDCYQAKDANSKYCIVRYKVAVKKRVFDLINSQYSKMYNKKELQNIKDNGYIQTRYGTFNNQYEREFDEPILVLDKNETVLEKICTRLGVTDSTTISIMKQNEYDSKFNLKNETINSKEL